MGEAVEESEAAGGPEDEEDGEGDDGRKDAELGLGAFVFLRFEVFFAVPGVGEFFGEIGGEVLEAEDGGDEVEIPKKEKRDDENQGEGVEFGHGGIFSVK